MRSAYGLKIPGPDTTLTLVGPGTPCGEVMRRYWHPVCLSEDLKELPKRIRILGEDLVAFRDRSGRPGLLFAHCSHRGASLEYGRTEDRGIRCCYHGWLYDVQGNLLDTPLEPPDSPLKRRIQHPCYPVQEYKGLVFAYMGPPDKRPLFPQYDILLQRTGSFKARIIKGIGAPIDTNWLQVHENLMDVLHLYWLHAQHSGPQFPHGYEHKPEKVVYKETEMGMRAIVTIILPDGREWELIWEMIMPTVFVLYTGPVADIKSRIVGWRIPVDDTHQLIAQVQWFPEGVTEGLNKKREEMSAVARKDTSYEFSQRYPDDQEAIASQGLIAIHALENPGTSDRGVMMYRRLLRQAIEDVNAGRDPKGVVRDPKKAECIYTTAGSKLILTRNRETREVAPAS